MIREWAAACALFALGTLASGPAQGQDVTYLSLGTGNVNGVYHPVGRVICRQFNRVAAPLKARCGAEATPGAVYNMTKLGEGELEFAFVQSDNVADALAGRGPFAGSRQSAFRLVVSLHPELVTLIVRAGAGIEGLDDLRGKRLTTGMLGSGSRTTWSAVEAATGWAQSERPVLSDYKPDAALAALCKDQLDAVMLLVGHPSATVRKALQACDTRLVPVTGPAVEKLVSASPHFQRGSIPAAAYGQPADLPSFGVRAMLVTSARTEEGIVYAMTSAILRNLDELRRSHPALSDLTPQQMVRDTVGLPPHPGAVRAYRELGLTN
jgi:TRAP transporter TAXI family solute receptor